MRLFREERAVAVKEREENVWTRIGFVFVGLLLPVFLFSVSLLEAQQQEKIPRIGLLGSLPGSSDESRIEGFRHGLRELGYVEGKNIVIEYRHADGKPERLPDLAAELVRLKVDILVARGAPAAHAAKNATSTIPIVIGNAADPVGTGLVASLARPGGNITGLSDFNSGVITRRLELLKEVVPPTVSNIAVFWNPANPTNQPQLKDIQAAAPALGMTLLSLEIRGVEDIERAFSTMKKDGSGALFVVGGAAGNHQRRIAELAARTGCRQVGHPEMPSKWAA